MSIDFNQFIENTEGLGVLGVLVTKDGEESEWLYEADIRRNVYSAAKSFVSAAVGFALQLGIFSDIGAVDTWQGWVKCALIGIGCGLAANKIYDREEIWKLLEQIFSLFKKK